MKATERYTTPAGRARHARAKSRFLDRVAARHGDAICVLGEYTGSKDPIKVRCEHGHFSTPRAEDAFRHGCKQCSNTSRANIHMDYFSKRYDALLAAKYEGRVEALEVVLFGSYEPIVHHCNVCGSKFSASPQSVLYRAGNYGCTACNLVKRGLEHRVPEATVHTQIAAKHGGTITLIDPYVGALTPHTFACSGCNRTWMTTPDAVIRISGCPHCIGHQHSKSSLAWLEAMTGVLGFPLEHAGNGPERTVWGASGKRYRADGFNEEHATVLEFNGDMWHGNQRVFKRDTYIAKAGRTAGELHTKTKRKAADLVAAGYRVISVWESDWKIGKLQSSDLRKE